MVPGGPRLGVAVYVTSAECRSSCSSEGGQFLAVRTANQPSSADATLVV